MKIWEYLLALCSKEEETTEKLDQFLYAVYMMGIKDAHEHRADDPSGVMGELGTYDAAYICSSLQEFTGVPAYFDFVKKMKNLEEK